MNPDFVWTKLKGSRHTILLYSSILYSKRFFEKQQFKNKTVFILENVVSKYLIIKIYNNSLIGDRL